MKTFERPNILLLYTDQQRLDTLSCYGDSPIHTKNIDMLAQEGARLDKCFVQNPVCGPSRMSFLTGRYCSGIGVGTNGIPFPEKECKPINQILKPYGYETVQIGKLHFQPHARRDHKDLYPDYGFDTLIISDEPGCYDDAYTKWIEMIAPEEVEKARTSLPPAAVRYHKTEYSNQPRNTHEPYDFEGKQDFTHSAFVSSEMCRFIKGRKSGTPFFAIAGFYAPHPPVNPPKDCVNRVNLEKIKLPVKTTMEETMPELGNITEDGWKKIIRYYLALALHVDDCIGHIIKALKETGTYDNTLIIFTSDHGEYLGDHGKIQKGMPGYDCITNVPMILRYPKKIKQGLQIRQLVEAVDIVPTVLDYCGIQVPPFIQGKSVRNVLEGKPGIPREEVLTENFLPYGLKETTIRTDKFKYYLNSQGKEILFDLEKDPKELYNVIDDQEYAEVLSGLRKRMVIRIQQAAYPNREQTAEY